YRNTWNESLPAHTKVSAITPKRRKQIETRVKEFGKTKDEQEEVFGQIISKIKASAFLNGENTRGWKPSFDWLFSNGDNWRKIYEGNYDEKNPSKTPVSKNASTATLPDGRTVTLGVDEYIHERGHRTLGQGLIDIPMDAPPRPSKQHYFSPQ